MAISVFDKGIRIALKKDGTLIRRPSAGVDFYATLPCDMFLFDTWGSFSNFYEKIMIGVFYKSKVRYIPCLKSSLISDSDKKNFQLDLEFYYKNTLYTFLWSGQWAFKIFGSQNIDYYLADYISVKNIPIQVGRPLFATGYFNLSAGTEIPQRIGLSYKWKFYSYREDGWTEVASLYNSETSANIHNGERSAEVKLISSTDKSPDSSYTFMLKAVSEIESGYCLIGINMGLSTDSYTTATINYEWKQDYVITAGTYTNGKLFSLLSDYIAENSYRVLGSACTISDGTFTITMSAGQRIWLCSQGDSPNYAKVIWFVDDENDWSGRVPQFYTGYENYNFYSYDDGKTGWACVDKRTGRYGTYMDVSSYDITITGGISFI